MIGAGKAIMNKLFKNRKGEWSKAAVGGTALNAYFGISEYDESRQAGNSVARSGLAAAGDIALGGLIGMPAYIGLTAAPALAEGAVNGYQMLNQYSRSLQYQNRNTPVQNATFVDTQQTYTMRQAGMNLARQGQYAAQQTMMGNEASSIAMIGS